MSQPFEQRLRLILLNIAELAPLEVVADRLAAAARELTGADYAAIGVYDAGGRLERFVTQGLTPEEKRRLVHPPRGVGVLGEFARRAAPIRVADVARHPSSTGVPPGHPVMGPFLGVPVRYGESAIGAFYVTRAPGRAPFDAEDEHQLLELAPYAAIAMANARTLEREQRRSESAAILTRAASALQATEDEREAGAVLLQALDRLFPALEHAVVLWSAERAAVPLVVPARSPLAAALDPLLRGVPEAGEHRFRGPGPDRELSAQVAGERGGPRVALVSAREIPPSDVDRDSLEQLAEVGAVGLAAVRRRAAEAALERYAIRDAIARDLHDDLIQAIYAIGLRLRGTPDEPAARRAALEHAVSDLNVVIRDLRAYIAQLSHGADSLTGAGLLAARIDALLRAPGGTPRWSSEIALGDAAVSPRLERQLYLVVREAVSNVHRHAQAREASLVLRLEGVALRLEVVDHGRGFDRANVPDDAVGLRSMEERVADVGGSIVIASAPGQGTTLTATIPLGTEAIGG